MANVPPLEPVVRTFTDGLAGATPIYRLIAGSIRCLKAIFSA